MARSTDAIFASAVVARPGTLTQVLIGRQIVTAEYVLRLTSPWSETAHGEARAGVLYPNIYLLLSDFHRAVFEWITAGAVRAP
jgi:hypothetical protein